MFNKENEDWISEKEAAAIIQLPTDFFRKLVVGGSLKGVVNYSSSNDASYIYNKSDIDNYIFEDSFYCEL